MVAIYFLRAAFSVWGARQAEHGRNRKGKGEDIWFWLGFICTALLPVHVHYHGDFKGDKMFHYLQDFCFTQGTHSSERCSKKITVALLAMISTNWHQRVSHHCCWGNEILRELRFRFYLSQLVCDFEKVQLDVMFVNKKAVIFLSLTMTSWGWAKEHLTCDRLKNCKRK